MCRNGTNTAIAFNIALYGATGVYHHSPTLAGTGLVPAGHVTTCVRRIGTGELEDVGLCATDPTCASKRTNLSIPPYMHGLVGQSGARVLSLCTTVWAASREEVS